MNRFLVGNLPSQSETFVRSLRSLWLLYLISALLGACSGFPYAPQKPVLATTNQAALSLINLENLHDQMIFPLSDSLKKAEIFMPLSPEGEKLYSKAWARFLDSYKAP